MANTYTQLYIQFVFAVKGHVSLIPREHNDELQKYITGIIQKREHKLLAINNEPDHMHIFLGLNPKMSISELMQQVKAIFSKFINDKKWIKGSLSGREDMVRFHILDRILIKL
jgi:REP-associated tyrosine transposase